MDAEARMAMDFMAPAEGHPIVDMSCGSGLFTREFLDSGKYPQVVAADFSENMLRQTDQFLREKGTRGLDRVALVRDDVARMPFETGSVRAVHAGAAIHCWPNPLAALGEISRVLAPGGVLVASTFMVPTAPLEDFLGEDLVRPLAALAKNSPEQSSYRWWEERELRQICEAVGLTGFRRNRSNRFIMFSATKPE